MKAELVRTQLEAWYADQQQGQHGALWVEFLTPGLEMPHWLQQAYPEAMAIILERRVWDMDVREFEFECVLTFDREPVTLTVPYFAVRSIHDARSKNQEPYVRRTKPPANDNIRQEKVVSLDAFRNRRK